MPGRPRSLDDAKQREVCAILTAGSSIRNAAQYVGCSISTIHREAARNEPFREQLRRAQANARLVPLQAMRQASQTHWRAAAWMLERSDPEQFGRPQPKSLGPKELRVLARDLLAIFDQEINNPLLRERISSRIQATISYAMRHAWDTRRTGKQLNQAMAFFNKKDGEPSPWDSRDAILPNLDTIPDIPHVNPSDFCDTQPEPSSAKPSAICDTPIQQTPSFSQPNQSTQPNNESILQ